MVEEAWVVDDDRPIRMSGREEVRAGKKSVCDYDYAKEG